MSKRKDPSRVTGNHLSKETKGEMIAKKKEIASKLDIDLISNMNEYPKIFKNQRGIETKESKALKKEWRNKFDYYRNTIFKQEDYPGQYASDNDIEKLAKLIMLEYREMDLVYRIATSFDDEEQGKLSTTLGKVSTKINSIKKAYPLDAESISALASNVDTSIKDVDPMTLLEEKKASEKEEKRQQLKMKLDKKRNSDSNNTVGE
ncbi:hypothetical protein [Romboutsia sp.]|uniref:hypothetical protein n=1 Tax=Romboutsia sp. TaxID=1965302 RepID=UPI003F40AEAD